MTKGITIDDVKRFRINLRHKIENAYMIILKWDRQKLAEEYGVFTNVNNSPYTKARINQLVNVIKGEEENSQDMFDWLELRIKELE